jgi:hypothetical protein
MRLEEHLAEHTAMFWRTQRNRPGLRIFPVAHRVVRVRERKSFDHALKTRK